MVSPAFLSLLACILSVAANTADADVAPRKLHLAKRVNATSLQRLLHHDRLRARYLRERDQTAHHHHHHHNHHHRRARQPITDQAVGYVANITVGQGNPPSVFSVTVDTGSSNTWVGANPSNPYINSSSTFPTGETVAVSYGSGSFSGTEYLDTVMLAPHLVIYNQSIGAASQATGFEGLDGILGIGPQNLTINTLAPDTQQTIPTLSDNLFAQTTIKSNSIAISFEPSNSLNTVNGEITWGGTDPTRYITPIVYGELTTTYPSNQYWGVNMSAKYGNHTIFSTTAGIVDTGTTLILVTSAAYTKYKAATGGVDDESTGLVRFTPAQYAKLSNLVFTFANATFALTPNAQTWPRSLNVDIGGSPDFYYGIVSSSGAATEPGMDFICGYAFLERFYSVYDTERQRLGLAATPFTTAIID